MSVKEIICEAAGRILASSEWWVESRKRRGEKAISAYVCHLINVGSGPGVFGSLPYRKGDTILREMQVPHGQADFAIFHMDGSASVIEVKDGRIGLTGVAHGIGQVGLYATQVGMANSVTTVRRALMWTSLGDVEQDRLIKDACIQAGVVPLYLPKLEDMQAEETRTTILAVMAAMREDLAHGSP